MIISIYYQQYCAALVAIYTPSEAALIGDWVFEKIARVGKKKRLDNPDMVLDDDNIGLLNQALEELLHHRPVQYVLGEAWFYNMKLSVNEQVLIPRPETEELVHWIIEDNKATQVPLFIVDIGTGSGCIAIALQKNLAQANTTAIDISIGALELAKKNARDQDVPVTFKQLDFLNEEHWTIFAPFNIVVSNPPYIPDLEKAVMNLNVLYHEPHTALFVPDQAPLLFYEKLVEFAAKHLLPGGTIYVEINKAHAQQTKALFESAFESVELKNDISGNERMIKATRFR